MGIARSYSFGKVYAKIYDIQIYSNQVKAELHPTKGKNVFNCMSVTLGKQNLLPRLFYAAFNWKHSGKHFITFATIIWVWINWLVASFSARNLLIIWPASQIPKLFSGFAELKLKIEAALVWKPIPQQKPLVNGTNWTGFCELGSAVLFKMWIPTWEFQGLSSCNCPKPQASPYTACSIEKLYPGWQGYLIEWSLRVKTIS